MKITNIEIKNRTAPTWRHRNRRERNAAWREYEEAPRVYVSVEDESLLENFGNRVARPYNLFKKEVMPAVFEALREEDRIGEDVKASWSQHAGCKMCPCSPGFVLKCTYRGNFDVWVTVAGDDAKRGTNPDANLEATVRSLQLAADPTIPTTPETKTEARRQLEKIETDLLWAESASRFAPF